MTELIQTQRPPGRIAGPLGAALVLVTAGLVAAAVGPGNLTTNPSFEVDVQGWIGFNSTLTREVIPDGPNGAAGPGVARVTWSGTTPKAAPVYTIDDVGDTIQGAIPGQVYRASAIVRAASPSSVGKPILIRLRERTARGDLVAESTSLQTGPGAAFETISVAAAPRVSGDRLDVYVIQLNAGPGDAFQVDDITLEPVAEAPTNAPPTGKVTFSPSRITAGKTVVFRAVAKDTDGTLGGYAWDLDNDGAFDDGKRATAKWKFARKGLRFVSVQVSDNGGSSVVLRRRIAVVGPGGVKCGVGKVLTGGKCVVKK